jgi:hypothetical protein
MKPMSRKTRSRPDVDSRFDSKTSPEFLEDDDLDEQKSEGSKINRYLCLVPVFGLIPSVMALVSRRSDRPLKDVSKVAIVMVVAWLISTSAGAADSSSTQASLEILKGTISSSYFAACIWLMFRLYKDKAIALPWSDRPAKSKRRSD